jgi:valyl-tRNA synthetase
VITPTALIQEKSADVVRYWASASNLGADIAYSEEVFKIGQKLITKLFNSAKFCSQHFAVLQDYFEKNPDIENNDEALLNLVSHPTDLWILNQLEQVINNYVSQFQQFEYAKAREILEDFFWKNFCDNYLEICKVRSYGLSAEKLAGLDLTALNKQEILNNQLSAIATLSLSLKNILKLFAPFVPHLTEELYSIIFASEFEKFKSIHARHNCAKLSLKNHHLISQINTTKIGENLLEIIFVVRKFKSEKNLSMKSTISLIELPKSFDITGIEDDILNVCNAQKIVLKNDLSAINIIE